MPSHTELKNVSQVGQSLLSDQLESNLTAFFGWGMLGIGGFFNVTIPSSGAFGGNQHRLRLVDDPNYQAGQVWEGFRKDWVWETGVAYNYQPIHVSGVYVNGGFQSISSSGAYTHHVDYPMGRVVFDSPIDTASVVTCEYSYRLYQWYTADTPWWQQIQPNSFRVDDSQFLQTGSGAWSILSQNRVQLPAVVVEAVARTDRRPFEIGSTAAIVRQDVLFHIIGESRPDVKQMHDIITTQWQKRLNGFDKNQMFAADVFPLDADGSPSPSGLMYPDLVDEQGGFYWNQIRLMEMRSHPQPRLGPIHYATVRATCEVDNV